MLGLSANLVSPPTPKNPRQDLQGVRISDRSSRHKQPVVEGVRTRCAGSKAGARWVTIIVAGGRGIEFGSMASCLNSYPNKSTARTGESLTVLGRRPHSFTREHLVSQATLNSPRQDLRKECTFGVT